MTDMPEVSWQQASARRMERSGLSQPLADAGVEDVVRAMHGTHAQVMSAAEISIALRTADATRADVRAALWGPAHTLVKTFGPRGTVHLLPAADLSKWLAALSAPPLRGASSADVRMSEQQTEAVFTALREVLADAELTLAELDEAVPARAGSWAGDLVLPAFQTLWPRWRQAVHSAAHRGVLCFGEDRGRNITYTSPANRVPAGAPEPVVPAPGSADADRLVAEFVRDYLRAYGPATPANFAKWLSAPDTWAARLFETLAEEGAVVPVGFEGRRAWLAAGDTAFPDDPPRGLRLLPYFDAYGVAGQPRELLFAGRAYERATARGQAGNYPVLLIDGVVAGVWHLKRSGKKADITVEPLAELRPAEAAALDEQIRRVGEIVEATPRLTVGPVTVGAHA